METRKPYTSPSQFAAFIIAFVLFGSSAVPHATAAGLKAALLSAEQVSVAKLAALKADDYNAVVLMLSESNSTAQLSAARQIKQSHLALYYWIEIARNPALADAHPEWTVPVLYEETFPVHLERVRRLLTGKPEPIGIFLNDLQGAPSACGCGNLLCRWTTDYGPLKTATRLPNDAAARFFAAGRQLAPKAKVIPVWTTECEERDAKTLCAGVGCFKGTCWREFTAQIKPLADGSPTIAALLPYKAFQRDLPEYGAPGWIGEALNLFSIMPLRYQTNGVSAGRVITVLQGWEVTPQQIQEQLLQAQKAGAAGTLVSLVPIDQSWEPRIFDMHSGHFLDR